MQELDCRSTDGIDCNQPPPRHDDRIPFAPADQQKSPIAALALPHRVWDKSRVPAVPVGEEAKERSFSVDVDPQRLRAAVV